MLGTASLMQLVGLSMALGAFLAGLLAGGVSFLAMAEAIATRLHILADDHPPPTIVISSGRESLVTLLTTWP